MAPPLLELPPELRNRIYELLIQGTIKPEDSATDHIQLSLASPPSNMKLLLCTCRQVYSEARLMYQLAYRRFLTHSEFRFSTSLSFKPLPMTMYAVGTEDLANIRHLTMTINIGDVFMIAIWVCVGKWRWELEDFIRPLVTKSLQLVHGGGRVWKIQTLDVSGVVGRVDDKGMYIRADLDIRCLDTGSERMFEEMPMERITWAELSLFMRRKVTIRAPTTEEEAATGEDEPEPIC